QFQGYKFDPNGEYVRRWLPELARLPTEWIHHPWDAPESVRQAAGIELGSNYPFPIVELDAARARLEEALSQMWLLESEEEGLGDSSESVPMVVAFPQDDNEPIRNNPAVREYEDQMVPSITTSSLLLRAEEGATTDAGNNGGHETRGEEVVPSNMNPTTAEGEPTTERNFSGVGRSSEDSTAESSNNSSRGENGGIVPVWSPSSSSYSDQLHPQSHQIINWTRLSQTG
ncbi:cryptochrome 1, partial [Genlisea aurea]